MNDFIPRVAAIEAFDDERVDRNYGDVSPESVIEVIKSIPAVDAAPVVHGQWIEIDEGDGDYTYDCSVCGGKLWVAADTTPEENGMKYCPYCGAKMDDERRNNN